MPLLGTALNRYLVKLPGLNLLSLTATAQLDVSEPPSLLTFVDGVRGLFGDVGAGLDASAASDLWAAGALFSELITGVNKNSSRTDDIYLQIDLTGRRVLEVSCGHGGGASAARPALMGAVDAQERHDEVLRHLLTVEDLLGDPEGEGGDARRRLRDPDRPGVVLVERDVVLLDIALLDEGLLVEVELDVAVEA